MKKQDLKLFNRAPEGAKKNLLSNSNEKQNPDWKEVLVDIIIKILTLGFYHIEKHKKN